MHSIALRTPNVQVQKTHPLIYGSNATRRRVVTVVSTEMHYALDAWESVLDSLRRGNFEDPDYVNALRRYIRELRSNARAAAAVKRPA